MEKSKINVNVKKSYEFWTEILLNADDQKRKINLQKFGLLWKLLYKSVKLLYTSVKYVDVWFWFIAYNLSFVRTYLKSRYASFYNKSMYAVRFSVCEYLTCANICTILSLV